MRQPGCGGQHHARPGTAQAADVGNPFPHGGRIAAGLAAHPAQRHHPQRPLAVRRAASAGGGSPGHGPQAPPAGPGRAHRLARREGSGPGRRADHGAEAAGHHDLAGLPRHRPDVPARRPHRGAPAGPDCRRPAHGRRAPRRRRRADLRPAGRRLRPPAAHPAARAHRPPGLGRPVVEPSADLVRARLCPRQRAAVHPPGLRQDPVLRRVARLPARAARPVGQAAVRPGRRPGGPGRGRRAPGHRRQSLGRLDAGQLPRPGQGGERGQLVVGPGARAQRAVRRDHGVPRAARRAGGATSSPSSTSTRGMPPALSSGTGCWTR